MTHDVDYTPDLRGPGQRLLQQIFICYEQQLDFKCFGVRWPASYPGVSNDLSVFPRVMSTCNSGMGRRCITLKLIGWCFELILPLLPVGGPGA